MTVGRIDKTGKLPIYVQLAEMLKQGMKDGAFSGTGRIPTERELCELYTISRVSVRSALALLQREGWILKIRGRGTFANSMRLGNPGDMVSERAVGFLYSGSPGDRVPLVSDMLEGAAQDVAMDGRDMMSFCLSSLPESFDDLPASIRRPSIGGVMINGAVMHMTQILRRICEKIPVVLAGCSNMDLNVDSVLPDNIGGVIGAVRYLSQLGHSRIGFIGGDRALVNNWERFYGYRIGLEECGLKPDARIVQQVHGARFDGRVVMELLRLKRRPTAVICDQDAKAFKVMRFAAEAGFSVPSQLSVVGFCNVHAATLTTPSLTTVAIPGALLGRVAYQRLKNLIDGRAGPMRIILPVELIERDSCAAPGEDVL